MKYDRIDGIEKDISKLVMGCDNQDDINEAELNGDPIRSTKQQLLSMGFTESELKIIQSQVDDQLAAATQEALDAKTPLAIMIFQNLLNIYLLIGLVNGQFGFPEMGVLGASYAWGISFTVGTAVYVIMWLSKMTLIPLPSIKNIIYDRLRKIFKIFLF